MRFFNKSVLAAASSLAVAACAGGGLVVTHSTFYDYRSKPSHHADSGKKI